MEDLPFDQHTSIILYLTIFFKKFVDIKNIIISKLSESFKIKFSFD